MTYLPPTRPHLPKSLPPPNSTGKDGNQAFSTWAFGGHLNSKLQQEGGEVIPEGNLEHGQRIWNTGV
jgi:hypothetical protein